MEAGCGWSGSLYLVWWQLPFYGFNNGASIGRAEVRFGRQVGGKGRVAGRLEWVMIARENKTVILGIRAMHAGLLYM